MFYGGRDSPSLLNAASSIELFALSHVTFQDIQACLESPGGCPALSKTTHAYIHKLPHARSHTCAFLVANLTHQPFANTNKVARYVCFLDTETARQTDTNSVSLTHKLCLSHPITLSLSHTNSVSLEHTHACTRV